MKYSREKIQQSKGQEGEGEENVDGVSLIYVAVAEFE